jgi:hypothetical protein
MSTDSPNMILSPGTQVVALAEVRGTDGKPVHPRGAVGVVIQSPADYWHSYRVRFLDGFEASFLRGEISILSSFQRELSMPDALAEYDRRGIYLPPANRQWSIFGVPEQLENPNTEEVYWEAQKFVVMALKSNPNVLECLYTPLVEFASPLASELLLLRPKFLSRMVYQTYNGYVTSQFKKLQADLRNKGAVKWKHVMHLLRLLLAGVETLESGVVPVHVGEHRPRLLSIKRGEVPFEQCEAWRRELHKRFDVAVEKSPLPERPDYAAANDWLVRARRHMAAVHGVLLNQSR